MKPIAVIGEGAWGTAIAHVLADAGHEVVLWCCDGAVAHEINEHHTNTRYMPGCTLPLAISACTDVAALVKKSEYIFISTPTIFFRTVVLQAQAASHPSQCWVVLSKGIENDTLFVPSQILADVLGADMPCVVLGGPSFAHDVIKRQLTGVMIGASKPAVAQRVAQLVATPYFYPFVGDDAVGIQLGGALKNALALLMGIASGAGYCDNTRALLFTRGWQEMIELAVRCGARRDTLYDLAGIGDLFLTVSGGHSRNLSVGMQLGKGRALGQILGSMCHVSEGVNTTKAIKQLIDMHQLSLPLFETLYSIMFESAQCDRLLQAAVQSGHAFQALSDQQK